jgi:hypothetical protein
VRKIIVTTRFNEVNNKAGKEWLLTDFCYAIQTCSLQIPELISLARAVEFNKQRVGEFCQPLEKLVTDDSLTPERIYTVDEIGFRMVHKPHTVFACKCKHQVGAITSSELGRNVTFVCCVNTDGIIV